jgi:hypothetical protein
MVYLLFINIFKIPYLAWRLISDHSGAQSIILRTPVYYASSDHQIRIQPRPSVIVEYKARTHELIID